MPVLRKYDGRRKAVMQPLHPWQNRGPERMNDLAAEFDRMYLYREKPVRYRDIEAASGSEDPPGFKEAGPALDETLQKAGQQHAVERYARSRRIPQSF